MKHPNTDWLLVAHESGADVAEKPFRNHCCVRVKNNEQVDRAYDYLIAKKDRLGLKKVVMRNERAGSYAVFFVEPVGNYWEIESYERHQAGLPYDVSYPWQTELSEKAFPGRGYIAHGFTHGTIECTDWAASVKFYKDGLEYLSMRRSESAITEIDDIQNTQDGRSFLVCDLNKNWWEIAAPLRHSRDNGNPD